MAGSPLRLRVADLTVRYPGRAAPALAQVSLALRQGERVLLLGPSGAGKSTLLLVLAGLIPRVVFAHLEGEVQVNARDPRAATAAALARVVSVLFQDPDAQLCMPTVEEEVAFGLENLGVPPVAMEPRIAAALAAVGLARWRTTRVDRLSGGMRQRLALAALLAMEAPLLLLDEPTAHLDPQGTREFFSSLRSLNLTGFLLVEHKLEHALPLIDRVAALGADGRLLVDGAPADVFHDAAGTLEAEGIWLPPAVRIARAAGLDSAILTFDELVACARHAPTVADKVLRALPAPRPPARTGPVAINVQNLTHTYYRGVRALDGITLRVPEGDFLALVGANGSGKTTLALHLAAILRPPLGQVHVLGRDISGVSSGEVSGLIGYVFQNPEHQFVTDTVLDEVRYTLRVKGTGETEATAQARQALQRYGLAEAADLHPYRLSQGAKRRLSVLTVLLAAPRVLVLDEPTFGQDARSNQELLAEMVRLNEQGLTVLMITHDMESVWQFARSVAIMHEGRILYQGPVAGLLEQAELLERAGLELPFAARVQLALRQAGVAV